MKNTLVAACLALLLSPVYAGSKAEDDYWDKPGTPSKPLTAEERKMQRCGADYKRMKVGMDLFTAQSCVADFKMTGQISTPNGVVSTYVGGNMFVNVVNGRVVSWGR